MLTTYWVSKQVAALEELVLVVISVFRHLFRAVAMKHHIPVPVARGIEGRHVLVPFALLVARVNVYD